MKNHFKIWKRKVVFKETSERDKRGGGGVWLKGGAVGLYKHNDKSLLGYGVAGFIVNKMGHVFLG